MVLMGGSLAEAARRGAIETDQLRLFVPEQIPLRRETKMSGADNHSRPGGMTLQKTTFNPN
jgi:hypothetical protein